MTQPQNDQEKLPQQVQQENQKDLALKSSSSSLHQFQQNQLKVIANNSSNKLAKQQLASNSQLKQSLSKLANKILSSLEQLNKTVINDISVKKGRRQKFQIHIQQVQRLQKQFLSISFSQDFQKTKYNFNQFLGIVYHNLAKLGDNEQSLQTAIGLIESQRQNKAIALRWKMQLAAMKSSSSKHMQSYLIAIEVGEKILKYFKELMGEEGQRVEDKQKMNEFLRRFLRVAQAENKNQIIWIHNTENNLRYFVNNIKNLVANEARQDKQQYQFIPFFKGYDFHIADYMSLQKIEISEFQKEKGRNLEDVVRELAIFCSISYFTRATEQYYMKNYTFKYLHFKSIQLALLAFDQDCTYIMFLLKVLNDHYGTKMSEIREENSELIETNQLKRKMPKDSKEVKMKSLVMAE